MVVARHKNTMCHSCSDNGSSKGVDVDVNTALETGPNLFLNC